MKYPTLTELNTTREMVDVFGGYNHNLRIGLGEFYDMKNLTSDDYPVLSPRRQRGVYLAEGNPAGMISKDSLDYVDGDRLYLNGKAVDDTENANMKLHKECNTCPIKGSCDNYKAGSTLCKKTLISMGAYIIIMPDKKYVNTIDPTDCGKIEVEFTTSASTKFTLCKLDGEGYDIPETNIGATEPPLPTDDKGNEKEEHDNLTLWLDTSGETHVLKQYSTTNSQWVSIATTYIKIASPGIGKNFAEKDGVRISGIKEDEVKDLDDTTTVIYERGDDYIIVKGILKKVATQEASKPITIKREMPNMDFIIESENRLWGCRYGKALNGVIVNELYACKLGDFKNWNCFEGVSTDSYVASVGTDGQFTGAITHLGYPLFFKETCIHKVYGNYPANYQIQTTACRGVQKGCSKSLAIVNETLFYKARTAICAYDGSLPVEISSALGDMMYSEAVAGALGNKYYISMKDTNEDYHLFVYDTLKGMWHREDETQAVEFCNCRGDLYYIDYDNKQIKTVRGTGTLDTSAVKWEAITGVLGTDSPDKKYISRIDVRLLLNVGSRVSIFAEYDSGGDWEHLLTMDGVALRSFAVPIRPKRCDHLRLKITGAGDAKIYSICKTVEQGSDV